MSTKVYFSPLKPNRPDSWNQIAKDTLIKFLESEQITLPSTLPLKIHTGEPGNITFIEPKHMDGIIDYLESNSTHGIFMETNMANGQRATSDKHRQIAKDHGFTRLPFIVADGDLGTDHQLVPIKNGKHFTECKIATELTKYNQVLILSHFKGHSMTGFGGALKMLGIGFASSRGKTDAHAKSIIPDNELIDWGKAVPDGNWAAEKIKWNDAYVYHDELFIERMCEYALAAQKPGHMHLVYATNLVRDCDCDAEAMTPLYNDLGIFASLDPVAIDKAILDMLDQREGHPTYRGRYALDYAEQIGLGSKDYQLVTI